MRHDFALKIPAVTVKDGNIFASLMRIACGRTSSWRKGTRECFSNNEQVRKFDSREVCEFNNSLATCDGKKTNGV